MFYLDVFEFFMVIRMIISALDITVSSNFNIWFKVTMKTILHVSHNFIVFFLCQEAVNHFNIICPFMYVVAAFWNEQDCLLQLYFGDTWNYITFREYSNTVSNGIHIASSKSQRKILAEDTPYSLLSTSLFSLWRRLYFFPQLIFCCIFIHCTDLCTWSIAG